jgi:hypothetical protein
MEDAKISVRRALGIKGLDKLFSSKEFIGPELLEPYVKDNFMEKSFLLLLLMGRMQ